jgi:hypothetical protein
MSGLLDAFDLDLAWRRTKADLQNGRTFVHSPLEIELVEADLASWLQRLGEKVAANYQPHSVILADVPKGNGGVRPAAMLQVEDRVIYAAIVGALLPQINAALSWSQGTVDFSYRLSEVLRRVEWFTNRFNAWAAFRNASVSKIDDGASHAVITDITGFYENIDLQVLFSDLRQLGCQDDLIQLLKQCLYRWCVVPGRGLPQGLSASDILSKVYLNPIDRAMIDHKLDFIRYVDDIRIFCNGVPAGKAALMFLTQSLRRRGLNLQSAKTEILSAPEAKAKIEGAAPFIRDVRERYRKLFDEIPRDLGPSIAIPEVEHPAKAEETPIHVIKDVFETHILSAKYLNKTLLHYLLKKLGEARDPIAVKYCLTLLVDHPQETEEALKYIAKTNALAEAFASLEDFLESPDNIYEFQAYQIFRWINSLNSKPTDGLIARARHNVFSKGTPLYLKAECRVTIQNHGTYADLERLEESYAHAENDFERAQVLASIKRMETIRRNGFYGRAAADGPLSTLAIALVKQGRL